MEVQIIGKSVIVSNVTYKLSQEVITDMHKHGGKYIVGMDDHKNQNRYVSSCVFHSEFEANNFSFLIKNKHR
jgi:hypothetical protein